MTMPLHVVCPHCDQVNRIVVDRPAGQAVCGRCRKDLFQGSPVDLDTARLRMHVARSGIPLIVDFWAPWCGPCRAMAPVFERAARELEPMARFVRVNVDENPEAASAYGVRGIPALFALKDGQVVAQHAGVADATLLTGWVNRFASR
ncbi:thioredoxin TrxC [Alsobacter sp. R-9]